MGLKATFAHIQVHENSSDLDKAQDLNAEPCAAELFLFFIDLIL